MLMLRRRRPSRGSSEGLRPVSFRGPPDDSPGAQRPRGLRLKTENMMVLLPVIVLRESFPATERHGPRARREGYRSRSTAYLKETEGEPGARSVLFCGTVGVSRRSVGGI